MHLKDKRRTDDAHDRHDVAEEVVVQSVVERCVDCIRGRGHEQRVAVGRREGDCFRGHMGPGTRPVLHNELLAQSL